ncbi:MAG: hypothetical protein GY847_19280 [Proteobacteria bacterium]|nr:hypothetical protein [Pseudomonadota bacterium]
MDSIRTIKEKRQISIKSAGILGLVFGILLGVSGLAIGQGLIRRATMELQPCEQNTRESNPYEPNAIFPSELPREWKWKKKAITFDHMYRTARSQ